MNKIELTLADIGKVHDAAIIIISTINKHLTIPELSMLVNLPEKKLKAGFMQVFRKGVYTYLKEARLRKMKEMLLADMPLKGIALETGYKDKGNLIKAFRNEFSVTPTQWKKEQLNSIRAAI